MKCLLSSTKKKSLLLQSVIKADEKPSVTIIPNKRPKNNLDNQNQDAPIVLIWDSCDYSCAYDALFTVLGDIWVYDPTMWTREFRLMSSFANKLSLSFQQVLLMEKCYKDARNSIWKLLRNKDPVAFPYGTAGVVDITDLFMYMFTEKSIRKLMYNCTECGTVSTSTTKVTSLFTITLKKYNSIQEHIDASDNKTKKCGNCDNDVLRSYKYNSPLRF